MWPLLTGLVTGGAGLLGSMFSADTSAQNTQAQIAGQERMQQQTQAFNADQAQLNRQFQTDMSNSAYTRASADMQRAGLNPAMMFSSGGAASTPGGSAASVGTPTMPTPQRKSALEGFGQTVASGVNAAVTAKTLDKMTDEIANLQAQRGKITAETDVERERKLTQEALTHRTSYEATREALAIPHSRFSAKSAEDLLSMPESARRIANIGGFAGQKLSDVVNPFVSGAGAIRRFIPRRETTETSRDGMGGSFTERFHY